jgi:hypothetical protein
MTLLAYHSDRALKKSVVAEMAAHRKADSLVQGYGYWRDGKGCAVGCLIKSGNHEEYEQRFGIPQALAHLEDTIFERLPREDAMKWPERFLKAAKPGADLSLVQWQFLDFVVTEVLSRPEAESVREACQPALDVVRARARGEDVSDSAAWSAESAESAAWKRYADKLIELMKQAPQGRPATAQQAAGNNS